MTEKELSEMRARCDAATPGPWKAGFCGDITSNGADIGETYEENGDPAFIAAARSDMPRLIDEVEGLQAEAVVARREFKDLKYDSMGADL